VQDAQIPWTDLNVGNAAITPERQRYQQAMREILAVYLRKDSGAAITPEEVAWYGPMLMPQPFEDDATVAQKIGSINGMRTSLLATSGGAYDEIVRRAADPNNAIQIPWAQGNAGAPNAVAPRPGDPYQQVPLAAPGATAGQPVQMPLAAPGMGGQMAPAGGVTAGAELQEAQNAIARGADRRTVALRYKQRTGQDLP
jgi:hypothetical protein